MHSISISFYVCFTSGSGGSVKKKGSTKCWSKVAADPERDGVSL